MVSHGISTYLKLAEAYQQAHSFARVATVGRYPNSPQDRPALSEASPVPGSVAPSNSTKAEPRVQN